MSRRSKALLSRQAAERRGRHGELVASLLLLVKGYRILGRRIRTHVGEIDLVAKSPAGIVCFVEVKVRRGFMDAVESVAPRQQARIVRAAEHYIAERRGIAFKGIRYDTVIIARRGWPRHLKDVWRP